MERYSKSRSYHLAALFIVFLLESGCQMDNLKSEKHYIKLRYEIEMDEVTKKTQVLMTEVDNINVFLYNSDGSLADSNYSTTSTISLSFHKGKKYSVYAIANVGDISYYKEFSREEGLLEYRYIMENPQDISSGRQTAPMTYRSLSPCTIDNNQELPITLKKTISSINLKADLSQLEDVKEFKIVSISLKNIPKAINLFSESRILPSEESSSESSTISGEKLLTISTTGVSFLALENMQGDLLEGNLLQSGKVFEESSPYRNLCTYIEIKVNYRSKKQYGNPIFYRFYLGKNDFSNFDVERNKCYNITFTPTNSGIDEESWRLDVSNLKPVAHPVSISLPTDFFTYEGYSKPIKAVINPKEAFNPDLKWEIVSADNKASISQNGIVTGIRRGTTEIKVSIIDYPNISTTQIITVKPAVIINPTPYFELTNYSLWPEKINSHYPSSAELHVEKAPNADIEWVIVRYGGQRDDIAVTQDGKITLKELASGHYTIQAKASTGEYYSDYACADIYYYLMYQDIMHVIRGIDNNDGTCNLTISMGTQWHKGRIPTGTFREMLSKRVIVDSRDTSYKTICVGNQYISGELFKNIPFNNDFKTSAYVFLSPLSFAFETRGNFGEGATFRYDTGDWNYYYVRKEGSFYNAPTE